MSKRALLVGIDNFIRPEWQLYGCINDTIEMQELLTTYYGFKEEDVKLLHDRDATQQGIRDGLAWLLSDCEGGEKDVRVFHFSSFGTQVPAQRNDEWDQVFEVIVPYDHDWDNPFSDDDLRVIIVTIPEGVNFTFIADLTDPRSIPQELASIVPNLPSVPIQPILQGSQQEYGMFEHFWRYPWVLELYRYENLDDLLLSLEAKVIAPAEQKVTELRSR